MRKIKSFIIGFILSGIIFSLVGVVAAPAVYEAYLNRFPIYLNGDELALKGYNINGNTYFQLRNIADNIGDFNVDFSDSTILLTTGNTDYTVHSPDTAIYYAKRFIERDIERSQYTYTDFSASKAQDFPGCYYVYAERLNNDVTCYDVILVNVYGVGAYKETIEAME